MVLIAISSSAQDEHFSQYYAIPMHMNPALTGAYEGTYRMTAIYRDQWNNSLDTPYQTFAAGGDTNIALKNRQNKSEDKLGVGMFFISDRVSLYQSNVNKLSAYAAYHKRLGNKGKSYLGAGIKFGIIQRNINYDNINFGDQFDQVDQFNLPTREDLPPNNFGSFDLSIGVNYAIDLPKSAFYIGAALHHVNSPSFSYFNRQDLPNPSIDISQKLYPKISVHASYDKNLNYSTIIKPRIIYQKQGVHKQIDLGTNLEYIFKSRTNALILGLWLTTTDDLDGYHLENITPLLGIRQNKFIFGFSYDLSMRDALDSVFGFNTFEFSIRFSGVHTDTGALCPTF